MVTEEQTFNINTVLQKLSTNVKDTIKSKHTELIYEMGSTIPKELRGDADTFTSFLTALLTFALENTHTKELVLYLNAPEDFFYEEPISFRINDSKTFKSQMIEFVKNGLKKDIEKLAVEIFEDEEDFSIAIPFKLHELGFRRHYRLSDKSMIDKNVLIVCESAKMIESLKEYFEYFHHHVDTGENDSGFDLTQYDILVTEDKCITSGFRDKIIDAFAKSGLKSVWIGEPHSMVGYPKAVSAYLQKPVTQESIWALIESLFGLESSSEETLVKTYTSQQNCMVNQELIDEIVQIEERSVNVLNLDTGDSNCKSIGLKFNEELKKFLEIFERSDLYFRQIVTQKEYEKVESFCDDVLKRSEMIGAENVHQVMESVKAILKYRQYDILPVYPGKYHVEYIRLKDKINYFLKG